MCVCARAFVHVFVCAFVRACGGLPGGGAKKARRTGQAGRATKTLMPPFIIFQPQGENGHDSLIYFARWFCLAKEWYG